MSNERKLTLVLLLFVIKTPLARNANDSSKYGISFFVFSINRAEKNFLYEISKTQDIVIASNF